MQHRCTQCLPSPAVAYCVPGHCVDVSPAFKNRVSEAIPTRCMSAVIREALLVKIPQVEQDVTVKFMRNQKVCPWKC